MNERSVLLAECQGVHRDRKGIANFSSMEMTTLFIGTLQLKISDSLHFAVL